MLDTSLKTNSDKPVLDTYDKLSDNFRYYELIRSSTAARFDIDNNVYDADIIERAKGLAENVLERVRSEFGILSPNSWYRCEELERNITYKSYTKWCFRHNVPIGPESWINYFNRKSHPTGAAADIEIVGVPNDTLYSWIHKNLEYDQLIREFPRKGYPMSGWVHVSFVKGANRGEAFTIG